MATNFICFQSRFLCSVYEVATPSLYVEIEPFWDPRVVLPPNVDGTEMFYQRLPWFQTTTPFEQQLHFNLWGIRPQEVVNLSGRPLVAIDLATVPIAAGVGHTGVQFWYLGTLLTQ